LKIRYRLIQSQRVTYSKLFSDLVGMRYRILIQISTRSMGANHITGTINLSIGNSHGKLLELVRPVFCDPQVPLCPAPFAVQRGTGAKFPIGCGDTWPTVGQRTVPPSGPHGFDASDLG